ncbi:hypothetical protein BC826DRAFT_1053558 [Russula brevipes]|nr:hypothetical protein BC826DRAFT_1053558 [Russula brevipes]
MNALPIATPIVVITFVTTTTAHMTSNTVRVSLLVPINDMRLDGTIKGRGSGLTTKGKSQTRWQTVSQRASND